MINYIVLQKVAQLPRHVPRISDEPLDVFGSTENIIVYVVIPVLIIILYIVWRRRKRREKNK